MISQTRISTPGTVESTVTGAARTILTDRLLTAGVVAGPIFIAAALAQALTRPGFDITRHAVSLLSLGDLGWIQIANFLISGALFVAGALGTHCTLRGLPGGTWTPILLTLVGLGMIGGGIFRPDPMDGFPPGSPLGTPPTMSGNGLGHLVSGMLAFLALIAVCYVISRRFAHAGRTGWAIYAAISGTFFLAALLYTMTGGAGGAVILLAGVATAMFCVAASSRSLIVYRATSSDSD